MSVSISTNTSSLSTQRDLMRSSNTLETTFKRLSSGIRINTAKDDPSGLSISSRMEAQVRGFNQSLRNSNDSISLSQIAQGAAKDVTDALQRMRELAIQAANQTYIASDVQAMTEEFNQLRNHISKIASQTDFNGNKLLDGTFLEKKFQVSSNSGETLSLDTVPDVQPSTLGIAQYETPSSPVTTTTEELVQTENIASLGIGDWNNIYNRTVQTTIDGIQVYGGAVGQDGGRNAGMISNNIAYDLSKGGDVYFKWKANGGGTYSAPWVGLQPYPSLLPGPSIMDTGYSLTTNWSFAGTTVIQNDVWLYTRININDSGDYTIETATDNYDNSGGTVIRSAAGSVASWENVGQQVSLSALIGDNHGGANASITVGYAKVVSLSSQPVTTTTTPPPTITTGRSLEEITLASVDEAEEAISVIDQSIKDVSSQAASFGAFQNRIESTIANLTSMHGNAASALSRIKDADMAKESADMIKQNIIQQATTAILAQANQQPNIVAQLLK